MPKISNGYVLQPRIFDGSEASKMSPVTRELWFYLLRNVNHKDNGKYKRGQAFFQFSVIQEDLSWHVGYRKMKYSKPQLTKALRRLCEGNMTATMKATRGIIITVCNYSFYQDPKNYEGNNEGIAKELRRESHGNTKNKNVKNVRKEIYSRVVMHLNKSTGAKYKTGAKKTQELITARLNENFSEEDFFSVIDNQVKEWRNDHKMKKYLRPETLFGTKFESYLNGSQITPIKQSLLKRAY